MAKRRGFWADLQRERAARQREIERANRVALAEARKAERERERHIRAVKQQAAADERARKRLYIEGRKADAQALTADIEVRISELDNVLATGVGRNAGISFASLKQTVEMQPFDPAGLDRPTRAPDWAELAPAEPGWLARKLGLTAGYIRKEAVARQVFGKHRAEYEAAEERRRGQLEKRRRAYDRDLASETERVKQHNADVDLFEKDCRSGDPEAVARYFTLVLDASPYPDRFPHRTLLAYRPEPLELVVEYELPPLDIVPTEREYRYVQTRDEIDAKARPVKEVKQRYASLIAEVTLRTLHEIFSADFAGQVDTVTFGGKVSAVDKATGQPIRPLLISVTASREAFSTLVLTELEPVACLRHLNALVSPHPHDLEAVTPVIDFDALLSMHNFVDGIDVLATLDSRPDLLAMTPNEFEHFTRQLFEAMEMKGWNTEHIKDDGVDAVITNEDPVVSGLFVVQAKRYSRAVGVAHVRELIGAIDDKRATKGILVTTSWVTAGGRALAKRNGRIEIFEGENLKHLCKKHLGIDIIIGLPKPPPRRRGDGSEDI